MPELHELKLTCWTLRAADLQAIEHIQRCYILRSSCDVETEGVAKRQAIVTFVLVFCDCARPSVQTAKTLGLASVASVDSGLNSFGSRRTAMRSKQQTV
eukprot:5111818-Amphidinium_carterae.1